MERGVELISLAYHPPFRWDALATFLRSRVLNGVDAFEGDRYVREGISIERGVGSALLLTVPRSVGVDSADVATRARRMFDLDADPSAIDERLRRDRSLPYKSGTRVPGAWEPFEVAVRAIVGQQITVRGATTIMERMVSYFNRFPKPSELASADLSTLGMPRSRIEAIQGMAREVAGEPSILTRAGTLEKTITRLTALRGIGPWTAHYIAMRALGDPDAFPDGDLGLRKAAAALGIDDLLKRAERWRPWRAYAALALWESL